MISYAQNFEDVILWRALSTVEAGYYIDIGAQHPVIDSVSLAFYEAGWRGVHVEPMAEYAQLLRLTRQGEEVIQAAVGTGGDTMPFYSISGTGLSTGRKVLADQHTENGFPVEAVTVPSIRLGDLLDAHDDRPIHWLKIDVEGMEGDVIESWRPSNVRPWIIVVESYAPTTRQPTFATFEPRLEELGYVWAHDDGLNRFYCHTDHLHLAEKLKGPPSCFDPFVLSPFVQGFRWSESAIAEQRRQLIAFREKRDERATDEAAKWDALLSNLNRVETAVSDVSHGTSALNAELERRVETLGALLQAQWGEFDARIEKERETSSTAHENLLLEITQRATLAERQLEAANQRIDVQAEDLKRAATTLAAAKQQIVIAEKSSRENALALQTFTRDPLWKAIQPVKRLKREIARARRRLLGKASRAASPPGGVSPSAANTGARGKGEHQFPNRLLPPASPLQTLAEKIATDLENSVSPKNRG